MGSLKLLESFWVLFLLTFANKSNFRTELGQILGGGS